MAKLKAKRYAELLEPLEEDLVAMARWAKATGARFVDIESNRDIETAVRKAMSLAAEKKAVFVRVNIDYSKRTQFTSGAVKTNFGTFDMATQLRLAGRAIFRKFSR